MNKLASTIRNNLDTLVGEYNRRLQEIEGYAELPYQDRFEAARYDLELIATCLEAGDAAEFAQFIQTRAGERMAQDFELEPLLQALTTFEETLQPLVTTVEAATFLWRALSQARTIVSRVATERVRASEAKFKFLADNIAVGVFVHQDGLVRYVGREGARILGYDSPDEIIGRSIMDFVHPSERERIADIARRRVAGEPVPNQYETRLLKKDNAAIDVLIYGGLTEYEGRVATQGAFIEITERKRAEEALRASGEKYRDLFENANDLIQSVAPSGSFLYVNRAWRETLGYSEEEISNLSVFDIVHPDSRAHCMEIFQRVMAGESIDRVEAMFVTRDGRTIAVEGSANCHFENGIPVATRGIFRDITERKRAEAERERFIAETQVRLRVSQALAVAQTEEEVLDAMIQVADFYPQAQVLIFTFDPKANELTAVVRRSESFDSGMVASTPIGMRLTATQFTLLQHISPDAPFASPNFLLDERIDPATREQISKGESVSFALLPLTAGNEWLGFIAASSREEGYFDEHKLHLYHTMADQGAVALQAARLRDALSLTRFTVDEGPDAIFWIRPDATLAYVNDTTCEMLGYSRKELLSMAIFDFDPNFPREIWSDHWQEAKKRRSFSIETQHKTKSGQLIPVEVVVNYLEYGGQEYHCAFARDITERKRAEEALHRLERAVEQSIDGIAVADMDGNIQFVNPAWAQMHGYSPEELLGRHLSVFHTEEQLQEDVMPFNERVMEFGAHEGEVGHVRKDGSTFPTWMTTTLLRDEKGNPVGLMGTARDITERRWLEQAIQQSLERRGRQVQTSTEVAQEIAAAPALDELFHRVVTLIKERFGYYHAQIFRYEPAVNAVVLVTSYGEAGERMLAEGHRLEMGRGVVGTAAATGQPVLATDVTQDADWVPNPHLPETKGELAVPIILREAQDGELHDQVLGILDVQSDSAGALTEEDQLLLEGLCGQIAIAIESTRLRQETEGSLRELERLYRAMSREGWETFQREVGPTGYLFDRTDVITTGDFWVPEIGLAMERQTLVPPTSDGQPTAVTPLSVRGEIIGALGVQDDPQLSLSPDDLALVESVSEQVALALESARLFEQTQAALAETEALYTGSDQVVRAETIDDVLQALIHSTALQRLDRVSVAFFNRPWEDEMPEEVVIGATWERSGEESRAPVGTRYSLAQLPAIEAVTRDKPAIFRDITTDERVYETLRALLLDRLGMRSMVLWPLVVGEQWIGMLTGQAGTALEIDEDEVRQIASLTSQAAAVIQNIRLFEETQRRAVQLETAAEVSRAATSILDTDQLLSETVHLIRDRLDLYYAGIFLLDEASEYAVLQAGTGEAGQQMLKQGHALQVGGTSMIGWCTAHGKARIALDVGREAVRFDNPLLPETRSEMALPLISRGQVIGAMTIQSDKPAAFSEEDISALQTMADQLANAIENARLYQETKANLEEITLLHQRYLQEAWDEFLEEETGRERAGYVYDQGAVSPASTIWRPEVGLAMQQGDTIALPDMVDALQGTIEEVGAVLQASPSQSALAVPLQVRGQVIGALDFYEADQARDWSVEDIAMVEAVASQVALAIENARAYEELQKTAKQLREMDKLKTQFLANMSHELRTPLNSIIGFSRVILKGIDGPINEQQRADLTSIYNNGQHLLVMINDILDISKIEAGKMELIFEPMDVQQIISGVMSTAIALVKDKPIELKQEVAPDLPVIQADGTRVRQVILNLLSNAAKFTEEGQITLRAWADEEQITVSVEDTGIGIAPEHQTTIFEEFHQVDASTTRRTGGTGLGLAISRHFVEMHNGRIWVESEPGVGSTFTFTLPITGPKPVVESELADLVIDPSRKLILAVESDNGAITIYKRYLEKHGYQVVGLNPGEQVVRRATELSPYAIILDVLLPDKDGWALLEELRSAQGTRQVPVIICTVTDDEKVRGLSLGAADYLVKPILEEDLLQSLQCLEERQQI